MEPLSWLGVGLQVVGLVVTGFGAAETWREFATESFWQPIAVPSRRTWAWIKTRLLRRPVPVHEASGQISATSTATAWGRAEFRTIPEGQTVEDSISELAERTKSLLKRVQDVEKRLADDVGDIHEMIDSVRREVEADIAALRDSDRRVATSGIRLEAVGLALIALGVFLHALGSFVA